MLTLKEMLDQRAAKKSEARKLTAAAKKEKRDLTVEEAVKVDAFLDEIDQLDEDIAQERQANKRSERLGKLEDEKRDGSPNPPPIRGAEAEDRQEDGPDLRNYSLLRAINLRCEGRALDGLEAEVSQEIAHRSGRVPQGFFMPLSLSHRSGSGHYERRDLNLSGGGGAVGVETAPTIIEILRKRVLIAQLGAVFLTGMQGDFEIPKQTGAGSAYWVTEGNAPTESQQTIGQVAFAPSTVGAFTDITRKFRLQSSIDAENFVRNDLTRVMGLELDRVGFNGSGSGAEPEGIMANSSVTTVAIGTDGGAATFAKMVEMETTVSVANADVESMAYVTSATGRGHLKTTQKVSGQAIMLWEGNQVNGYNAHATNQIPSNLTKGSGTGLTAAIFGNWADAMYALWSATDILVDPYTFSNSGTVRVTALQDADFQLRRTESFVKILDIDT